MTGGSPTPSGGRQSCGTENPSGISNGDDNGASSVTKVGSAHMIERGSVMVVLSPSNACFAGNCNRSARMILLTLCIGTCLITLSLKSDKVHTKYVPLKIIPGCINQPMKSAGTAVGSNLCNASN